MNSIKLQPLINSLDIDYQRGKSLTLAVNSETQTKQQQFFIWSILLIVGLIGLALAFQFTTLLDFDTKGILWLSVLILWIGFSIFQIVQHYSKTPYTFKKISFESDKIKIHGKGTPRIIPTTSISLYTLRLNQEGERPKIIMLLSDNQPVRFQLDNMQDFPVVTDGIADVLKFRFKAHQVINDFVEELSFERIQ
ncbi:MAG: hypothetical protein AB8G11_21540 [Saprospiraceae bacterium]